MNRTKAAILNEKAKEGSQGVLMGLKISQGYSVADLGSGGGYFTYEFSKLVGPAGRVYAVDADDKLLSYVKMSARKKKLSNVYTVIAEETSPNLLIKSCDLIFIRNVFHHIKEPAKYFVKLKKYLKDGGRVAVIDWKPETANTSHGTAKEVIEEIMSAAGYTKKEEYGFLANQNFMIFTAAERLSAIS